MELDKDVQAVIDRGLLTTCTTKQNAIRKIYNHVKHDGIYNDEGWAEVHRIVAEIENMGAEVICAPTNDSLYTNGYPNTGKMDAKSYDITVTFTNINGHTFEIPGHIICSGCGSVDDPLSRYDVVMTF